ncbi:hypothetical protein AKO1_010224 [Acrasis kona]|uniref:PB1 domain-containing protein n=1 Tax=Acrasis kona TaxID=1008807 RepID=A0AAW2ZQT7_9EUKA
MTTISVKIYLEPTKNIRRFGIDSNINLKEFEKTTFDAFKISNTGGSFYDWKYQDDEEDWVSFSSEEEWADALSIYRLLPNKVLRIILSKKKTVPIPTSKPTTQPPKIAPDIKKVSVDNGPVNKLQPTFVLPTSIKDKIPKPTFFKVNEEEDHEFEELEQNEILEAKKSIPRESVAEPEPIKIDSPPPLPSMDQSWTFMEVQNDVQVQQAKKKIEKYPEQLKALEAMGFDNKWLNKTLLEKNNGQLHRVVQTLLSLTQYKS